MLQISLAPAPVALQLIDERRRHLFIASREIIRQPDSPAGPAHQSGFHKIMAQYGAAQGRLAGKLRQPAILHKRVDADDGIVPEVLGVPELPEMKTGRQDGTVHMVGKLLQPGDKRFAVYRPGNRLQNPDIRPRLHGGDHSYNRFARHDAVGVEHNHIAVAAPPTAAKIGDVAAFALQIRSSIPVENTLKPIEPYTQVGPGDFFQNPFVGIIACRSE